MKAAFIYNFAKFVEWPERVYADSSAPFIIGVLGDNPFDDALADLTRNKQVHGRDIIVRYWQRPEDVEATHILFISSSKISSLGTVLQVLRYRPILTVGDTEHYAEKGCIVNLILRDSKVSFEVNLGAAKRAGLHISSRLLRLAEIVPDEWIGDPSAGGNNE